MLSEEIIIQALGLLGAVLTALIGWASAVARRKWGIEIEAGHRAALHSAIMSGARVTLDALSPDLPSGAGGASVPLPDQLRREVIAYVTRSVPGAIAALSPAPDVLDRLVVAKVQELIAERLRR
ncbi:hypothetical protein SAMN05444004_1454 [Jannaschia faecimaris]|uniref:Uncharacterized protein n=1 Tax=Jannaschia faecimaris TaxID=1244108 RepID=A0A1H3UKH5_9RHOB|nr:hypothetical protein [Jannaschia faecimaris]SDZ62858.1 hypothetical protein SAMN05444004_1454 [Jannaschia faecimaris]